ncbi:PAS domain S-box protein [Steroidobacter cummioxidans]|uniref:PAS domain S-box protein n=1 Tax=Steroidobacter cummioxidans TaxID=1803913 RepID=UPI000E314451|nr:PAS domain S-box protein [Steroidobacter cummioxidans]
MATHLTRDDSATNAQLLDLQRVFDLSQDLMCMTDAQTRFVRVSASSARILGYPPEELIGRTLLDLVHPNDLQSTLLTHESVLQGAQVVEFENRCVRKDGTSVELSWTSTWIAGPDGAGATYSVARDITNRKRAERLRESQREVLQLIVAGAPLGDVLRRICSIMEVFDADAKCAVTVLDAAGACVRSAFSPSLPSRFLSVVQDTLLGMPHGACANALRSGQTATCADMTNDPEWQELAALGAEHGLRACWFTPVFGARGRLIAVIAVYYPHPYQPSDRELVLVQAAVSLVALAIAHAHAQTQLKESLTRVELAQSIARLGYWERDLSSDKLNVYGEANAILGIPGERTIGLDVFLGVVLEADRPALIAAYGEANRGDTSGGLQFRVRHPDGSVRHVHAERCVIRDESGRATHIIGTMQDVTERNQADLERQRYLNQMSALADAARKVNSVLTVDELLQIITEIARDLVGAHVAVSVLQGADEPTVECCKTSHSEKYSSVVPGSWLLEGEGQRAGGAAAHVTRIDRSTAARDMALGTQWQACGCITVSLAAASGRRIGVLCVADKQSGEFAPNDERVLGQLADLAAVGLENARLYAELEERVRKRTQELQESNRELEAFSYSVSHDLRGPLRAIAGFTGLLRDRHYETIDADGRRCIDRVLAGTQRMSNLIDDLLELGRVTRVEIRRRQVDLSEYARATLTRLREASPERAAALVIEPQLSVAGDPGLLAIVLENLLDNAWKFTASRPVAEIRFGAVAAAGDENERTFFVQDNGVGFDPRYAANLFGVFQRLHAAGEFPGTGVGLATVQRIVQRHGGRIWADAAVDRGATIYFSIAEGPQ